MSIPKGKYGPVVWIVGFLCLVFVWSVASLPIPEGDIPDEHAWPIVGILMSYLLNTVVLAIGNPYFPLPSIKD